MTTRTRALKFTAVLTFVVLSLTGFSRGGHHSGHSYGHGHSGDSGGGCSSSHQSQSGYHHDYDDDDDYGGSGTSAGTGAGTSGDTSPGYVPSAGPPQYATVNLVSCATEKRPYATVEVTNSTDSAGRFTVSVSFVDVGGATIASRDTDVDVSARTTKTVKVPFGKGGRMGSVDHCDADPEADPVA
ncbi:hypothetical protein ME763_20310 [Streptomyces murinus]|uniref:hypothetical protein n=1 Tax=Streptomyces murinus TaxID=33900 RepID=UPI000A1FDA46|nr:hypothetical protein [Streptomyces murinus]WDO07812.1 hypothetical protein ME763_20310 [Streptomyces murinus]